MSRAFIESGPKSNLRDDAMARNLDRIAWLMDRAFTIPGTQVKVGLDAILGLLPIGGDVLTGIVQAGLVLIAIEHYRVPRAVAARMLGNVLLDVSVGAIPILGDLFDVGFKANTRNVHLLDEYRRRNQEVSASTPMGLPLAPMAGVSWLVLAGVAVCLLGMLALLAIGFLTVVRWIVHS